MTQWADVSSTASIAHANLDFDLRNFDSHYDPIRDLEANCPMCRTHTTASPDDALARELETRYPAIYAERRAEEETARGGRVGQDGIEGIMILIGNKHRIDRGEETENIHDWTFFVRTSRPDIVKEVIVNLVRMTIHLVRANADLNSTTRLSDRVLFSGNLRSKFIAMGGAPSTSRRM